MPRLSALSSRSLTGIGLIIAPVVSSIADPVAIGSAYGGGFYVGQISSTGNGVATHFLVVSPKATGEQFSNSNTVTQTTPANIDNTSSPIDGLTNSNSMVSAGGCPAATWCRALTIGGFTDWYLPSFAEIEMLYYTFKPTTANNWTDAFGYNSGGNNYSVPQRVGLYTTTIPAQTSVTVFQAGNSEACQVSQMVSSTQSAGNPTRTNAIYFNGAFGRADTGMWQQGANGFFKSNFSGVQIRAVRKVPV